MNAQDIPLQALLERAKRRRDAMLEQNPLAPRFRPCEALGVAQLDAVIGWLEQVPRSEWIDEYLERPRRGIGR